MAGQIIRQVVQVPRKVDRLAWLTSQAPAYSEQLPWYHKPPPPPDPPPHPDQRGSQARVWAFSPMPAYAESVVWRHPQPQPPEPPPLPDQRGQQAQAWAYSPMPGYAETLAWWNRPPVEVRLTNGASTPPWSSFTWSSFTPTPTFVAIPWLRPPQVRETPSADLAFQPISFPPAFSGGSSDMLLWRRRPTEPAPVLIVQPSGNRWNPWSYFVPPGPPGPPPSHAGILKQFVDRVPDAPQRLRRHTEKVADMLNSLLRQGILYSTDIGVWAIDVTRASGSGLTGTFNSGAF